MSPIRFHTLPATVIPAALLIATATTAQQAPSPKPATDPNAIQLITPGHALDAWKPARGWSEIADATMTGDDDKQLEATPGHGMIYNGPKGGAQDIVSKDEWGDVHLVVEFMIPRDSNSGVYLQGRYEIQILDSYGKKQNELRYGDNGGLYERWDDSKPDGKQGYEGTPPRVNASRKPGQWQRLEITFHAPRFDANGRKTANARFDRVVLNGVVIHENVEPTGPTRGSMFGDKEAPTGPLRLQGDHGPVVYRAVSVRPIGRKAGGEPHAGRTLDQWAELLTSTTRTSRLIAANAIAHAGPDATPLLLDMLHHNDPAVRYWAARGLALLDHDQRNDSTIAAPLAQALDDTDFAVRITAAYALRGTPVADRALAILTDSLQIEQQGFANVAADYLGWIGPDARPALPALRKLHNAKDYHLKNAADRAIALIEPQ